MLSGLRPGLIALNLSALQELGSTGDLGMRKSDQTIRDALKKAQAVLCQYLEPNGPNENQTVKQLFGILNDPEVIRALEGSERPTSASALLPIPALCPD
jgi:hypothetical protein